MEHYDVAIIGAGMSGLAAGIRLAHFGKRVCIFERHNAPGGLNSFYSKAGRKFDVGLHAMTNFVKPGVKGAPLNKILRQLRISREDLDLNEQKRSRIAFPGVDLTFTNDFSHFEAEVADTFPKEIDGFRALTEAVRSFDDMRLDADYVSAREVVQRHISNPVLEDMLFCPIMYYGSATERDMDFSQFVIMFKSLFFEGFARPLDGIRVMMRVLLDRYRSVGGIRRMKTGVKRILAKDGRVDRLILDSGEEVTAELTLSSAGRVETDALLGKSNDDTEQSDVGQLSFVETMSFFDAQTEAFGWNEDTIVFFNASERFQYRKPESEVDPESGVICIPNNFDYGDRILPEGLVRITALANRAHWKAYSEAEYASKKSEWFERLWKSAERFMPKTSFDFSARRIDEDMFTPLTVERFTWHRNGAIYGSPRKQLDGKTELENLYLCGTDQGYLGIVGSMLSGITIANLYGLR